MVDKTSVRHQPRFFGNSTWPTSSEKVSARHQISKLKHNSLVECVLPPSLPIYFVLSSGFHPAAFITHLSSSEDATLIACLHFILLCFDAALDFLLFSSVPWLHLCLFSNPIFFFNSCCVKFFIGVVHEGDVAVLIAVCV